MSLDSDITFQPWPQIRQLHNVVKSFQVLKEKSSDEFSFNAISYRGKVKLHGQNGAMTLEKGKMRVQSRTQFIDKTKLGNIIYKSEDYFRSLFDENVGYKKMTIFGEWCGPKAQKGVALSNLKNEIFAIFGILIDDDLIYEPDKINEIMTKKGTVQLPPLVYILPWQTQSFDMNFMDKEQLEKQANIINDWILEIEKCDPWVKSTFGIEGIGEGLVLYPIGLAKNNGNLDLSIFSQFVFKAKGEQHRVVKSKTSVTVDPQIANSAKQFVDMMVTTARLEQGAGEIGYDIKKLKKFISWIIKDIHKEGKDELEASNLTWKDVTKLIISTASNWYKEQCNTK